MGERAADRETAVEDDAERDERRATIEGAGTDERPDGVEDAGTEKRRVAAEDAGSGQRDGTAEDRARTGTRRVEVHPGKEAVVEFDPALTFECVPDCTWCCHHGVLLYDDDFHELAERAPLAETTTRYRGEDFVRTERKDRESHVDDDGEACAFLREDGLCALHDEHDWKPTRCSVFPLAVREEGGEIHVDVRGDAREHCDGLGASDRRLVDELDAFLPPLLWELEDPDTAREL